MDTFYPSIHLSFPFFFNQGMPITSVREIKILMETSRRPHPNIVLLKEVAVDEAADAMFLVFE